MELKEVLEAVPGLSRRFVYYLEARGYISPTKVHKQRIARREYSQQDLEVIREVWRYYRRGYSLQTAYQLAVSTDKATVYLGLRAPYRLAGQVVDRLRSFPQVTEVSVVHGADQDLLIRTDTPDQSEVYHELVPALAEMGITGLPSIHVVAHRYRREDRPQQKREGNGMLAYVLMRVPGKDVDEVMDKLKTFPAVREASTIYGESDIIAKVETADQEELDALVMKHFHDIPAVESTRTFIVVKHLHWSR